MILSHLPQNRHRPSVNYCFCRYFPLLLGTSTKVPQSPWTKYGMLGVITSPKQEVSLVLCDCFYCLFSRPPTSFWFLVQVSHSSRASTCQALLLLGHREFGIGMVLWGRWPSVLTQISGSMEQGWLYIGVVVSVTCVCLAS